MNKYLFIIQVLVLYSYTSMCRQNTNINLQNAIDQIAQKPFYKHASLGISVRDLTNGELKASLDKDRMLMPASSLKLITTLIGCELLSPEFRFETNVSYDGVIENDGTLKGNIYIEGSGDPTLGSNRIPGNMDAETLFKQIVTDIRACGILCIEGNIIADESVFNSFPISPSWQWNDLGNYYAAGAWGLNVNENEYSIYYNRSGPIGSVSKIVYFEPFVPNLELSNEVTIDSSNTGDNSYIFGGPYHYGKRVVGTIPQGRNLYKIKGSLPDPPLYFAYRIFEELAKRDMGGHHFKTQYHPSNTKSARKKISSYLSPQLKTIVRYTNDYSINIYCESILKTLGFKKRNSGAGSDGIEVINAYLKTKGLDTAPLHMEDGSGLSSRNLMSPDFMAEFLQVYLAGKDIGSIVNMIPLAGERGTVKNILSQSKAKGNIWLKSGSMDKTLTYAGICKGASGRFTSFSVFLNASPAKKNKENKIELEKILEAIYRFS